MAKSLNKVQLIGNLGQDPEMKSIASGTSVCNVSIATTKSYKDRSGQWQDKTEWHRVVLWDYLADNAGKYLKKGSKVYIEGELETRSWEQDGITRYITEIRANQMIMLDGRQDGGGGQYNNGGQNFNQPAPQKNYQTPQQNNDFNNADDEDDDVPF